MKLNRADLDTHIQEERGQYSDLLEAVTNGKSSDLHTMYEHGNDILALDSTDSSGNTLLHVAVRNGRLSTSELLIQLGINANVLNKNNETPLHHAVSIKDEESALEIIEMMLFKGANPLCKDKLGDTPTEKAKRLGKSSILMLFSGTTDERIQTPAKGFRL
jgi:ankyrin repeat protein